MKLFGYSISLNVLILIGIFYLIMVVNALSGSCNREGLSMAQGALGNRIVERRTEDQNTEQQLAPQQVATQSSLGTIPANQMYAPPPEYLQSSLGNSKLDAAKMRVRNTQLAAQAAQGVAQNAEFFAREVESRAQGAQAEASRALETAQTAASQAQLAQAQAEEAVAQFQVEVANSTKRKTKKMF